MAQQNQNPLADRRSIECPAAADINSKPLLKYWEIDHFFKCPIVGTCLGFSEQKQLLKKAGISIKNKSIFRIHETLVASSDNENRLSRKIDRLLNRKFGHAVALLDLSQGEFMAHFKTAFTSGEYAAELWMAAARPDLCHDLRREIFGEIHMSMHGNAEQTVKLKQKLNAQAATLVELQEQERETGRQRRSLQKENKRLKKEQTALAARLSLVEKDNVRLTAQAAALAERQGVDILERENRELRADVAALRDALQEARCRARTYEEKNLALVPEIERQRELSRHFETEARQIIQELFALNRCDPSCPSFDLCRKRILIVGGITRMESLYRELIETSGGVFEYHDGYMKKGVKALENQMLRADLVLCPVSCNSHGACSAVKTLGKKHNKTVLMMDNFSLNAVSRAIQSTNWNG